MPQAPSFRRFTENVLAAHHNPPDAKTRSELAAKAGEADGQIPLLIEGALLNAYMGAVKFFPGAPDAYSFRHGDDPDATEANTGKKSVEEGLAVLFLAAGLRLVDGKTLKAGSKAPRFQKKLQSLAREIRAYMSPDFRRENPNLLLDPENPEGKVQRIVRYFREGKEKGLNREPFFEICHLTDALDDRLGIDSPKQGPLSPLLDPDQRLRTIVLDNCDHSARKTASDIRKGLAPAILRAGSGQDPARPPGHGPRRQRKSKRADLSKS